MTSTSPPTTAAVTTMCQDSDTAWMLMASVLVLGMFPGVAFFEAGLLRAKNTTTVLAQVFCGLAVLSVMWITVGFSLAVGDGGNSFIGDFTYSLLLNVADDSSCTPSRTIPLSLFALFQLMFACITPLLMTGAYAERLAWTPFVIFTVLWELFVYYPVAHWLWAPNGWLAQMGAVDFAGGIVIHTTAGVGSLVVVLFLGQREHFDRYTGEFPYSSLPIAAMGTSLLWTGWFGFNGGSAFASNQNAVLAVMNSQIGATFAACTYMIVVFVRTGRPSTIAIMNGAIAGLAGVTPASGFIKPQWAILLGVLLGLCIAPGVHLLKHKLRIDDALEVSVVHGLTGIIGSVYIGFAATSTVHTGLKYEGVGYSGDWSLLGLQCLAVCVCGAWSGVWSALILVGIKRFVPLRVPAHEEHIGLDVSVFRESHVQRDSVFKGPDSIGHTPNTPYLPPSQHHQPSVPSPGQHLLNGDVVDLANSSFGTAANQLIRRRASSLHPATPQPLGATDPLQEAEEPSAERLLRQLASAVVAQGPDDHPAEQ